MQNNQRQVITGSNGERIVVNILPPGQQQLHPQPLQQPQQFQQQPLQQPQQFQHPHQQVQRPPRVIQVQIPQLQPLRPRITQVQIQQQHQHRVQVGTIQVYYVSKDACL